ncbi:MAG TPA: transglutaminase, partial [Burkholderiaceae bacterium]|nr:transglutaminase [Burkholderiaceae bacterium]
MPSRPSRRRFIQATSASLALASVPRLHAEEATHRFDPRPAGWRTFELTTTVRLLDAKGGARLWLPVAALDTPWQRTEDSSWSGNATDVHVQSDGDTGA